jgi:hypothetical protein
MRAFRRLLDDLTLRLIFAGLLPVRLRDRVASLVIIASLAGGVLALLLVPMFWPNIQWTAPPAALNRGLGPNWACANTWPQYPVCWRKTPTSPTPAPARE